VLLSATAAVSGAATDSRYLGELATASAGLCPNRPASFMAEMSTMGLLVTPAVEALFLVPRMSMLFSNGRFLGHPSGFREFVKLRQSLLELLESDPWLAGPEVFHVTWRGGLTDWHEAPLLDCLGVMAPGTAISSRTTACALAAGGGAWAPASRAAT
jgi:hypothetical protein